MSHFSTWPSIIHWILFWLLYKVDCSKSILIMWLGPFNKVGPALLLYFCHWGTEYMFNKASHIRHLVITWCICDCLEQLMPVEARSRKCNMKDITPAERSLWCTNVTEGWCKVWWRPDKTKYSKPVLFLCFYKRWLSSTAFRQGTQPLSRNL